MRGDQVQPFRAEVAARLGELSPLLLDRLDAMTDRMIDVLLRTEPAYRDVLAHGGEEMWRSTRANLQRGMHLLIGAASGDVRTSLRDARDVGRRRAAQGIPLEAVLRAYRLGGQVTWDALLEVSAAATGTTPCCSMSPGRSGAPTTPSARRWPRATGRS